MLTLPCGGPTQSSRVSEGLRVQGGGARYLGHLEPEQEPRPGLDVRVPVQAGVAHVLVVVVLLGQRHARGHDHQHLHPLAASAQPSSLPVPRPR
eukprot:2603472-Rhodomonas_salina.2